MKYKSYSLVKTLSPFTLSIGNGRIVIFDSQSGDFIVSLGQFEEGEGRLIAPTSLAVDREGHIFICDQSNQRLQVYDDTLVKTLCC